MQIRKINCATGGETLPSIETTWPATLRALETAGYKMDGTFGCDSAEHAELLDAPDTVRIVRWYNAAFHYPQGEDGIWYEAGERWDVQCFQARLGTTAMWESCAYVYRDNSQAKARGWHNQNIAKAMRLVGPVDYLPDLEIDIWVKEHNLSAQRDLGGDGEDDQDEESED